MSITTKHGDTGHTRLIFGQGVGKDHPVIAAVGDADELNAVLGLSRLHVQRPDIREIIARVQEDIVGLMGMLSAGGENAARYADAGFRCLDQSSLEYLTAAGENLEAAFPDGFRTWSVPGASGNAGSAWLELARTVCRRAERSATALLHHSAPPSSVVIAWLNRLSDVLWLAARREEGGDLA